jgi:hypothetical protein
MGEQVYLLKAKGRYYSSGRGRVEQQGEAVVPPAGDGNAREKRQSELK